MDTVCVNKIWFLTMTGHNMCHQSCEYLEDGSHDAHHQTLDKTLRVHDTGGHKITEIEHNNEFASLMDNVSDEMDIKTNQKIHKSIK